MMNIFKKSSLFVQIFIFFGTAILLISLILIAIPNLDPRNQKDIPKSKALSYQHHVNRLVASYTNKPLTDKQFNRINANSIRRLQMKLFFTDLDGNLLFKPFRIIKRQYELQSAHKKNGAEQRIKIKLFEQTDKNQLMQIRNFISLAYDFDAPIEKKYQQWKYSGPFFAQLNGQPVRVYFGEINRIPPLLIRFIDHPVDLFFLIMLISTPVLFFMTWRLTQPARKLAQAANRVGTGNFELDVSLEKGTREFQQTGKSFNQMVAAINQMMTDQQRLLSDISHELRSPLTRLSMATSLAIRKQGSSKELERIDLEASRLEQMIAELLSLSRMQLNSHRFIQKTTTSLLWKTIIDDAQFEASQLNKQLKYDGLGDFAIEGNTKLLQSALENVIRNAIKYAQKHIFLSFSVSQNKLLILVDDDGIGVEEGERALIFKPFYRVSTARDRTTGGTGLGLAIVDSTIRQHHGSVEALESPLHGLRIKILLPLA